MYSFSYLEPVCCSMSSSNCCFLTCIQVSQEAGKVIWYSRLFKNVPQFVEIHTAKGFSFVSEAEVDVYLESFSFSCDPADVGSLIIRFLLWYVDLPKERADVATSIHPTLFCHSKLKNKNKNKNLCL